MQFGATMFPTDYAIDPVRLGRELENRGFDSLFFPEHTHIPTSRLTPFPAGGELPDEYRHTIDPFVALGAIAATATQLKLGTGILLIIERDTITTAREVASLDHISNGRVLFGIGAGWNREEMANHGTEYPKRWRKMREQVLAMKEIWTKDEAQFHGDFVNFDPIWQWPKPAQRPHPPVIIGGDGPKAKEALLEYGDGWIPRPQDRFAPLADRIAEINQLLAERGRAPVPIWAFGAPLDASAIEKLEQAGVGTCVFRLPSASPDEALATIDQCTEVMRRFA
jgi:probable F420-dependent oxidoreductase